MAVFWKVRVGGTAYLDNGIAGGWTEKQEGNHVQALTNHLINPYNAALSIRYIVHMICLLISTLQKRMR